MRRMFGFKDCAETFANLAARLKPGCRHTNTKVVSAQLVSHRYCLS
jgi:hypothetical protein